MHSLDERVAAWISTTKATNGAWSSMVNRDHVLAALGLIETDDLCHEAEILQSTDEFLDADLEDLKEGILLYYTTLRHHREFTKSDLLEAWSEDVGLEKEAFAEIANQEGVARPEIEAFLAECSDEG